MLTRKLFSAKRTSSWKSLASPSKPFGYMQLPERYARRAAIHVLLYGVEQLCSNLAFPGCDLSPAAAVSQAAAAFEAFIARPPVG